jgi:hypothetical protein
VELYLHSPNSPSCSGARLKHRGNFTINNINMAAALISEVKALIVRHSPNEYHTQHTSVVPHDTFATRRTAGNSWRVRCNTAIHSYSLSEEQRDGIGKTLKRCYMTEESVGTDADWAQRAVTHCGVCM